MKDTQRKITNNGIGFISEEEILKYSHKDCNAYLSETHTKKELSKMLFKDKIELVLDLEYNFQQNSI